LVGVDARSTYCYLLAAESRDENTWGFHLLEAMERLHPEYTIADAKMRAGQKAADTPCHGDLFHIQQCQSLTNILSRQAAGATSRRQKIEADAASQTAVWE